MIEIEEDKRTAIIEQMNKNSKMNLDHHQRFRQMRSSSLFILNGYHHSLITLLFIVLFSSSSSSIVKGL